MKYPILYPAEEQLFNRYGLAILNDAYNIQIRQILNGEYKLEFTAPLDDKLRLIIDQAYWVKCEETIFYISKINYEKDINAKTIVRFYCEHIQFFLRNTYVNSAAYAGDSTEYIVDNLLTNFSGSLNRFIVDTSTPSGDNQKFEFRDKSIYECFVDICNKIGGEIICSNLPDNNGNFRVGIRKPEYDSNYQYQGGGIGSFKLNIEIRNQKNIVSLKKEVDKTNVVTKLHIFGQGRGTFGGWTVTFDKNGLPLHPSQYITIPQGVSYFPMPPATIEEPVKVGYFQYSNIFDKDELYWAGKAKWEELRQPRINYDINIVDLRFLEQFRGFDSFQVGDVVHFIDQDLGDENNKIQLRVTEYTRYPMEPERNSAVFASVVNNAFYTFADFYKQSLVVKEATTNNGEVLPEKLASVKLGNEKRVTTPAGGYGGVLLGGLYKNGVLLSRSDPGVADNKVFLEENGEIWIVNQIGAGFVWSASDDKPNVVFPNDTITPVVTEFDGLNGLGDVEITNPQNGQFLKYDASSGVWRNSF